VERRWGMELGKAGEDREVADNVSTGPTSGLL
jgi:hypothetical protein